MDSELDTYGKPSWTSDENITDFSGENKTWAMYYHEDYNNSNYKSWRIGPKDKQWYQTKADFANNCPDDIELGQWSESFGVTDIKVTCNSLAGECGKYFFF